VRPGPWPHARLDGPLMKCRTMVVQRRLRLLTTAALGWLCLALQFCGAASAGRRARDKLSNGHEGVQVSMTHSARAASSRHQLTSGLRELQFCLACPDPHLEGTQVLALGAVHGPGEYKVKGELAYAVPNLVGGKRVLNPDQMRGRVAFVDRGLVPLVEKIMAAQKAGAVGVVIADDGSCGEPNNCGLAGNMADGGFSKLDPKDKWKEVRIPSVLVSEELGNRLRKMMKLRKINVPNFGEQLICT